VMKARKLGLAAIDALAPRLGLDDPADQARQVGKTAAGVIDVTLQGQHPPPSR
jgi:hypothetical protein